MLSFQHQEADHPDAEEKEGRGFRDRLRSMVQYSQPEIVGIAVIKEPATGSKSRQVQQVETA